MENDPDDALVPSGDASADDPTKATIETLERFRERLLYFAARRLRNWAEAEDVAQETLRRALEALRSGRVENLRALPGFLFQTAVHICQHRALSAGREARALHRFALDGQSDKPKLPDVLHSLISSERSEGVRRAIEKLDANERELLALTYVQALPTSEIARRLKNYRRQCARQASPCTATSGAGSRCNG